MRKSATIGADEYIACRQIKEWHIYSGNPVLDPVLSARAYYPTVLYSESKDFEYNEVKYPYVVYYAGASGGPIYSAYSLDMKTWIERGINNGIPSPGYHQSVSYISTRTPKYYLWYWDATSPSPMSNIHRLESEDGFHWSNDIATVWDLTDVVGFVTNAATGGSSYGICQLWYNLNAINISNDPRNYTYWGYINLQYEPTGAETLGICYSPDGENFKVWKLAILGIQSNNNNRFTDFFYHKSWISVIKINDLYLAMFSGGNNHSYTPANSAGGISKAISHDGLQFNHATPCRVIFSAPGLGVTLPYATERSYIPSLLYDSNRFGGNGDMADIKMLWSTKNATKYTLSYVHAGLA